MAMSEEVRQFYLNNAGVRMWYAKKPLPGAAPSPTFSFPAEAELHVEPLPAPARAVVSEMPRHSQASDATATPPVDLQSLMATGPSAEPEVAENNIQKPEPSQHTGAPSEELPPVPAEAAVMPAQTTIEARLALWVSKDYLLIGQWSDEASERLQDTLARNILKAMAASDVGERQEIQWPVFRNPKVPGNGVEDFRRVLTKMVLKYPNRKLIMLGVLSEQDADLRAQCLGACLSEAKIDFPQTLAELSGSPSQKRELWQAIQKQGR